MRRGFACVGAAVFATAFSAASVMAAEAPTFNKDVAPIIYEKCASCHRPGEVAPMSLLSYQEARPWIRSIKAKVSSREMPPWFADDRFSTFADKKALTKEQIDTIVKWVDAGAPQGTGQAPAAPKFIEGWSNFMNRPPDAIVEMPMKFEIPAEGELPNFTIWGPNPFKEDKFMEAVQLRPEVIAATHHSDVVGRPLPEGTKLGKGPAWPGGPALDFAPMYPDGTSYSVLMGGGDLAEREHSPEFEKRREEARTGRREETDQGLADRELLLAEHERLSGPRACTGRRLRRGRSAAGSPGCAPRLQSKKRKTAPSPEGRIGTSEPLNFRNRVTAHLC